jgi:hypothetical protein
MHLQGAGLTRTTSGRAVVLVGAQRPWSTSPGQQISLGLTMDLALAAVPGPVRMAR